MVMLVALVSVVCDNANISSCQLPCRLAGLFAELCNTYYREEGRRMKSRIDRKSAELHIRYCFKARITFSLF